MQSDVAIQFIVNELNVVFYKLLFKSVETYFAID